jgi:hypothetical protein
MTNVGNDISILSFPQVVSGDLSEKKRMDSRLKMSGMREGKGVGIYNLGYEGEGRGR